MRTLSLRAPLAWLTIASLVFTLVAPAVSLSAQAAAKPAAAKPATGKTAVKPARKTKRAVKSGGVRPKSPVAEAAR